MIHANQFDNIIPVSVSGTEIDNSVVNAYHVNNKNISVQTLSADNFPGLEDFFSEGEGINILNRTISVDGTVVALKSDLENFLTSEDISNKANSATTLAGYGILDGITYEIIEEDAEEEE